MERVMNNEGETGGVVPALPNRGKPNRASKDHKRAYILTDRKPFYHATYEDADRERKYLEAKTGKSFRLIKTLNISGEQARQYDCQSNKYNSEWKMKICITD